MIILFRDELGYITVEVDEHGINFLGGIAYFSDGDKDYEVYSTNIMEICMKG